MANIYITEQGAIMRKTGQRIVVEKEGEVLLDVPCAKVDTVIVFGNVQITTQALSELLDNGIELAMMTRHGRLKGQLTPPKAKNVLLRMRQYQRSQDAVYALNTARAIVQAKIENATLLIDRYRANYKSAELDGAYGRLCDSAKRVAAASSLEELNGVEGSAAREYFAAFAIVNRSNLPFPGRRSHPSTDPVNALLSFGYTLVVNELSALLDAMGFDPYIGFLHALDYGRPSLALDQVEEFRHSLVDRFTLAAINRQVFAEADFTKSSGGPRGQPGRPAAESQLSRLVLQPEALKHYFAEFEKFMGAERVAFEGKRLSFRTCFRRQAERLASALETGQIYQPFRG
jgi:CRISPR-associated protein Cas1